MNTEIDVLKAQVKELTLACAGKDAVIDLLKDEMKMLRDNYRVYLKTQNGTEKSAVTRCNRTLD